MQLTGHRRVRSSNATTSSVQGISVTRRVGSMPSPRIKRRRPQVRKRSVRFEAIPAAAVFRRGESEPSARIVQYCATQDRSGRQMSAAGRPYPHSVDYWNSSCLSGNSRCAADWRSLTAKQSRPERLAILDSGRPARLSALDDVVNVEDVRRIGELDAGGGEDRH